MRQWHIQETVPHLAREVDLLAREILLRLILYEDVLTLRLYFHRLPFAHPFHRLPRVLAFDVSSDSQVFEVVVDEVDGVLRLRVADGGEYVGQALTLEG